MRKLHGVSGPHNTTHSNFEPQTPQPELEINQHEYPGPKASSYPPSHASVYDKIYNLQTVPELSDG